MAPTRKSVRIGEKLKHTQTERILDRAVKGIQAVIFLMDRYGTHEITFACYGRQETVRITLEGMDDSGIEYTELP